MATWGSNTRWGFGWRWGSDTKEWQSWEQGYIPKVKPDTVVYCRALVHDGTDRVSEFNVNVAAGYPAAIDATLTTEVDHVTMDSAWDGVWTNWNEWTMEHVFRYRMDGTNHTTQLFSLGTSSNPEYVEGRMFRNGSGTIYYSVYVGSSTTRTRINWNTVAGDADGTDVWRTFVVSASFKSATSVTGTPTGMLNSYIHCLETGLSQHLTKMMGIATIASGADNWVFGENNSGDQTWYNPLIWRLSTTAHSSHETYSDFARKEDRTSYSHPTRRAVWLPQRSLTDLADDGSMAGPIPFVAAADMRQKDMFTWGPLENWLGTGYWWGTPDSTLTGAAASNKFTSAPRSLGQYQLMLGTLAYRPVPPGCGALKVRAVVGAGYNASGGSAGTFNLRIYCMAFLPGQQPPGTAPGFMYATQTVTASVTTADFDPTSDLATIEFDPIPIFGDGNRCVYLCFARNGDDERYISFYSVSIEPMLPTPGTVAAAVYWNGSDYEPETA